jgi:hypothetical protein
VTAGPEEALLTQGCPVDLLRSDIASEVAMAAFLSRREKVFDVTRVGGEVNEGQ